jgi:hypothetical protein
MEWILRLVSERAETERARHSLQRGGTQIWEALKRRIQEAENAYNAFYPGAASYDATNPNAPHLKRQIPAVGVAPAEEKRRVTLQFHAPTAISATYSSGAVTVLTIVLRKDGVAALQHNNQEITVDRACEVILRDMLVEDL